MPCLLMSINALNMMLTSYTLQTVSQSCVFTTACLVNSTIKWTTQEFSLPLSTKQKVQQ